MMKTIIGIPAAASCEDACGLSTTVLVFCPSERAATLQYVYQHTFDKESHAFPLDRVHFLVGKPSRLFNGLLDIFGLQIRIAFQDFFDSSAVGDLAYDHRNRNAHATDACPSPP